MSFLKGLLGGVVGAGALSLVKDYLEKHGGVEGAVAEFEKTGFGQQAKSWVSTGPNLPITADQIKQALGSEKLKELAATTGIPIDKAADMLASICLPPSTRPHRAESCRLDGGPVRQTAGRRSIVPA